LQYKKANKAKKSKSITHLKHMPSQYLHGVVAASDVFLVDEDAGDGFLSGYLMQQLLVVGPVL